MDGKATPSDPRAMTPASPVDRFCRRGWMIAAVAALLIHLPTLGFDFTYDDHKIVVENGRIRRLAEPAAYLWTSWWGDPDRGVLYRPATMGSFAFNYAVGELNPRGYHLVNIALHAVNAGLLWWLAWLLAGRTAAAARAATAAGLLFAVHAVHVEAVAGVVGRAELMMTLGYLLALAAARLSQEAAGADQRRRRWSWAALAGAMALLAAASKEHGATLPLAIAALALMPVASTAIDAAIDALKPPTKNPRKSGGEPTPIVVGLRDRWKRLTPAMVMAAAGVAVYMATRRGVLGAFLKPAGATIPSVDNPLVALEGAQRAQGALAALARSAGLMVLPLRPSPNYGIAVLEPTALALSPLWPVGLALALATAAGVLFLRRHPFIRLGLALLAVSMALSSNLLVPIGTVLGERLLYLPSAAVCLIAAGALLATYSPEWTAKWTAERTTQRRRATVAALAVWGTALAAMTALYLPHWRDNPTLLAYGVARAPRSVNIQLGCATENLRTGNLETALTHADEALRLMPGLAKSMALRGVILAQLGREDEALPVLERVCAHGTRYDMANRELARILTERGDPTRAERLLQNAVLTTPNVVETRLVMAEWLAGQGRRGEAQQILGRVERVLTSEQRAMAAQWLGAAD
jgi:Flp pilus assembly protein TadD